MWRKNRQNPKQAPQIQPESQDDDESDLYVGFPTSRSDQVYEETEQDGPNDGRHIDDIEEEAIIAQEKYAKLMNEPTVQETKYEPEEDSGDEGTVTSISQSGETPNILQDLAKCSWESLDKHIQILQSSPELVIASLSVTDPNDYSTPIHVGSWKAPPSLAMRLIDLLDEENGKGVLVACDQDGNTALHLCAANLQPNVNEETRGKELFDTSVLLSLAHKAKECIVMQNAQGDTPVHLLVTTSYSKPLEECADDDISLVNALSTMIELNPSVCMMTDSTGATPLHSAIAANAHSNILATLLKACSAATLKEDKQGMLPLHYCAAFAKSPPSFIDALVLANPAALTHQTLNGDTPLHLAISNANSTLVQNGKIDKEALKILQVIINKHTSEENSPLFILNKEKLTPLHCCALFDAPSALTKLIIKHPLGSKAAAMTNSFGATALHLAAAQPGVAVSISSITTLGTPEAAAVQDRLRRTALHVASQNVHATGQLISALVKLNPDSASTPTQRGHLPLHLAAQSQAKEQVIKELIKAYPDGVHQKNKSGNMPLHDALKYKATPTVVKLLLDAYPDAIYAQNNNGYLPLHCAAAYKSPTQILQLLIQKYPDGAAIQCKTLDTPLHFAVAASKPSLEVIRMLLKAAPASILITNGMDENALEKGRKIGCDVEILDFLENALNDWT